MTVIDPTTGPASDRTLAALWRDFPREFDDAARFNAFLTDRPEYFATQPLSQRRLDHFARLDETGQTYLDFTGSGLYGEPQVQFHTAWLLSGVYGNPHSANPPSQLATEYVEQARAAVLMFFRASADDYEVIFTANASGAIKLVGEAYPFGPDRSYCYLADNHNSVVGVREIARAKGARISVPLIEQPRLDISVKGLRRHLRLGRSGLFAYPAQSNFSGTQHDLDWIATAQEAGWDVLLDAAAFVPTNRLDLSRYRPDFVCLSFYKMFGWPTGVGCLLARKSALAKLQRPAFAGGTIDYVSALGDRHQLSQGAAGFEDGTVNFLSLAGVTFGLAYLETAGIDLIHDRTQALTGWLLNELMKLRHRGGQPRVELYGNPDLFKRGATIAFNLLTPDGRYISPRTVEAEAAAQNMSLRTGCFCNPGCGEIAFGAQPERLDELDPSAFEAHVRTGAVMDLIGVPAEGAVRASLGAISTFRDAERFRDFVAQFEEA